MNNKQYTFRLRALHQSNHTMSSKPQNNPLQHRVALSCLHDSIL